MLEFYDINNSKVDVLTLPETIQGSSSRVDYIMRNAGDRGLVLVYKIKDRAVGILESPKLLHPGQTGLLQLVFNPGPNRKKDVDDFLEIREA